MTRIALTTAAMLIAMGTAFAGSDHYGSNGASQPAPGVDRMLTGSVHKHQATQDDVAAMPKPAPASAQSWPEPGQGIWGN